MQEVREEGLWTIWYQRARLTAHSWGIKFWEHWIFKWAKSSIRERNLVAQQSFNWMKNECKNEITYQDLEKYLDSMKMVEINEEYNKNYYSQSEDVYVWPKDMWNSIGFITSERCQKLVVCNKCTYEWK